MPACRVCPVELSRRTVFAAGVMQPGTEYTVVHLGLRAPRVAIVVDGGVRWMDWFRVALAAATRCWGGAGFVLVPHRAGLVDVQVLNMVVAYDPDYVVTLQPTLAQLAWLRPETLPADVLELIRSTDPVHPSVRDQEGFPSAEDRHARKQVAAACSPYRLRWSDEDPLSEAEDVRQLPSGGGGGGLTFMRSIPAAAGGPCRQGPDWSGPAGLVAAGRYGIMARPAGEPASDPALTRSSLLWLLDPYDDVPAPDDTVWHGPPGSTRTGIDPRTVETAFSRTTLGLTEVRSGIGRAGRDVLVVAGDEPEDFAVSLAWRRVHGPSLWLPSPWWPTAEGEEAEWASDALRRLVARVASRGHAVRLTSATLSLDLVEQLAAALRTPAGPAPQDATGAGPESAGEKGVVVGAVQWRSDGVLHLGVVDQFDEQVSLPTSTDAEDTTTLLAPPPAPLLNHALLAATDSLRYEVDLAVPPKLMPRGRGLPGEALLAPGQDRGLTWLRSSRTAISYQPHRFNFVWAGTAPATRLARPLVRELGMLPWVQAQAERAGFSAVLSQAGRRVDVLRRLIGNREQLAELFAGPLLPVLRAFAASGRTDIAYPLGEGDVIRGEGYLTFPGMLTIAGDTADEVAFRDLVDRAATHRLLYRGTILGCGVCERPAFVPLETLAQTNTCPHCASPNELVQRRWRHPYAEPVWYYHLHPVARDLLADHGEIPLLLAHHLRHHSRRYADVAEVELLSSGNPTAECDLVASVDGRVAVAEVKSSNNLGRGRKLRAAIGKRIRLAEVLQADQIILATTEAQWDDSTVDGLRQQSCKRVWMTGRIPAIRLITGLATPVVSDEWS